LPTRVSISLCDPERAAQVADCERANFIPDRSKASMAGIFSHPPSPTL
jgi:hypothetical protein